jgi:hypothetical protein
MADIINQAQGMFGGFGLSNIWSILSYGILFLVIAGVVGFFLYRFLMSKKFNKQITFFKKNASTGKFYPYKTIKAMSIRFDSYGNIVYRLKSPLDTRNVIERLKIEVRPNVHWVAIGKDGKILELEGITDIDKERHEAKTTFIDDPSELARSSMQELARERYDKPKFMEKYGALMVNIGAMAVIMVFLWLIADKLIELVTQIASMLDKMETLQTAQTNILDSLNNLLQGSGLLE